MTYPPQPPGPPQPPYGQQPPGPYGPNTPWSGQQPGYPVGPPPPKPKTGLITSLIIVAILVVGGGGVGAYFLLSNDDKESNSEGGNGGEGGDEGDPRSAADSYVKALQTAINTEIEDVDLKPMKSFTCSEDYGKLEDQVEQAQEYAETATNPPSRDEDDKITLGIKDFKGDDKGATFTLTQKQDGDEGPERELAVAEENGDWRVCGLFEEPDEETDDNGPSTSADQEIPNPIPTTG